MQTYFQGKTVLITGATGFIGSVLLQTLLTKLPGIGRVYCLYRNTPGLRHPAVEWVRGDIGQPQFGLDDATLDRIQDEVQVIFHLAAYTRWDAGIGEQVLHNTLPVLRCAELAAGCQRLESCVITSSYWATLHLRDTHEFAETVFQDGRAEAELDEILSGRSEARVAEWPNAYSYSKNLAERLLHQRHPDLPIVLARVTSACGAWEFPHRGHSRFDNALPAFLRSIVLGGVRVFPESMKSAVNDAVPVDICVNMLIANAVEQAQGGFAVIHCAAAHRNLPKLGALAELCGEPLDYRASPDDLQAALAQMAAQGHPKAAKLNRLIVDTYRLAMESRYVYLDTQARRPLRWMTERDRELFPIDVDVVDWPALIGAMVQAMKAPPERAAA
ncbi:SDR family oxidoreductase [Caldimonas brevitalea]|uniref:Fatty acyl-CoA reductase n=1 Tax=Caldimonas brevitalea TaxID=413882 RepID=A0A0G3BDG9_9BURK|nr:SDR family oxidoreductase [Caldimonas brevitalea]AKJ27337.1 fatty acyl-CoA reductase [Caldimonas brevitalea]